MVERTDFDDKQSETQKPLIELKEKQTMKVAAPSEITQMSQETPKAVERDFETAGVSVENCEAAENDKFVYCESPDEQNSRGERKTAEEDSTSNFASEKFDCDEINEEFQDLPPNNGEVKVDGELFDKSEENLAQEVNEYPLIAAGDLRMAKQDFFAILERLSSSEERHQFIIWLDAKITEAKLMGRIVVTYEEHSTAKNKPKSSNQYKLQCSDMFRYNSQAIGCVSSAKNSGQRTKQKDNLTADKAESSTDTLEENLVVDESQVFNNENQPKIGSTDGNKNSKLQAGNIIAKAKNSLANVSFQSCCEECGKSFANKSTLKRHRLLHSGVRYTCEQCLRSFSRRDYLKIHLKKCKNNGAIVDQKEEALFNSKNVEYEINSEINQLKLADEKLQPEPIQEKEDNSFVLDESNAFKYEILAKRAKIDNEPQPNSVIKDQEAEILAE